MTPDEHAHLLEHARKAQSVGASILANMTELIEELESIAPDTPPVEPPPAPPRAGYGTDPYGHGGYGGDPL